MYTDIDCLLEEVCRSAHLRRAGASMHHAEPTRMPALLHTQSM